MSKEIPKNPQESEESKLTMDGVLSNLSEEEKKSLKDYYTTGNQDANFDEMLNRKFFITLGVAAKNEGIGMDEGDDADKREEKLKEKVLEFLG